MCGFRVHTIPDYSGRRIKELRIRMPDLPDTESAKKKLRIENVDGAPEDLNVKMLMP